MTTYKLIDWKIGSRYLLVASMLGTIPVNSIYGEEISFEPAKEVVKCKNQYLVKLLMKPEKL